ncbi:hypothetical protein [Morganella morganii]|uniref:hypothetical protein n=2 Tax=Morganella morganii TaxID=582 RepID=UPI0012BC2A33|nr:hypothetical protein [Morganella morganii]MDS0909441.1 hypothetical protein [Morganella morganii]HAU5618080.1 hypothetical protein [Morganella morganii]HCU2394275.1 hypothetical protein [Morganella morganii]HDQ2582522.1 hypothetical protein [Morganella morganii]HED1573585.1 hypothetical protein [Morganella morganii]
MDYFLARSDDGIKSVLHKKICKKLQQVKGIEYIGYYLGEYRAIRHAKIIAKDTVILCPVCLSGIGNPIGKWKCS